MLKEFKEFAIKGNVVDMAVGVIIGAAFGKIVTSLVADIIMPPLGLLIGKVDFKDKFLPLNEEAAKALSLKDAADKGLPVLRYGVFLNSVIDFLLVAMAIFIVIKLIAKLRPPAPPPSARHEGLPAMRHGRSGQSGEVRTLPVGAAVVGLRRSHGRDRPVRLTIVCASSTGSSGLLTWVWKPADKASMMSLAVV